MGENDTGLFSPHDIPVAFALLSRLPVKIPDGGFERGAHAAWAYPLVGAALAGVAGLSGSIMIGLGFSAFVAAVIALGVLIILSGALHEDGLADTADGFWGGCNRLARLKIMKDSHIGTYGVLALVLSLALRIGAMAALFDAGHIFLPMIAAAMFSRAGMVALMAKLPLAREDGLARSVGRPSNGTAMIAIGLAMVTGFLCIGWATFGAMIITAGMAIIVGLIARAKIGGQTGDVLGAAQQIIEISVLLLLVP